MGRPTFFIDDRPYTIPLFATYVPEEYYYKQMAAIGCKTFNFQTNCSICDIGFSNPTWKGPDEWDFSQMDERANRILKADPNAFMLPRIYIGTPLWWREKYPEEMIVLDHGGKLYKEPFNQVLNLRREYPSLASKKWRQDMAFALRKTIEHIKESNYGKNIIGFEIAALGSEEWYHMTVNQEQLGDYSIHMKRAFQDWLRTKYGSKENLQKSWNRQIDFNDVDIPAKKERFGDTEATFRDPAKEMDVIDFYIFYSEIVADTIDYFAAVVKDATQNRKVVGAFYDYMYEFRGGPEFGHNAGAKIVRSKNIDFICAPPSYYQRQLGSGAECYRRPFLTGTLHNKIWFHDNDLATFLFPKVMKKHNVTDADIKRYMEALAVTPTAQETIWLFERSAGFVLAEGIYESFFDLHGGYFDDPRLLDALGRIVQLIDRGKDVDRSSIAEILVVADEVSLAYGPWQSDWPAKKGSNRINEGLLSHQIGFIKSGAPFDSVLLADIELVNLQQYKIIMFLNTWHLNNQQRDFINKKIKVPGKTIIWCYAPGIFNENKKSIEAMQELTGFKIVPAGNSLIEPKVILNDAAKTQMQKAGEEPYNAAFGLDGKLCMLFSVNDDEAQPLGLLNGSNKITFAKKQIDGWTSIYSITPVFPPSVVRWIAKSAGVHIFNDKDDTIYVNKSYIAINAGSAGTKTLRLPLKSDVYEAFTEKKWFSGVEQFETSLMYGETQIFRYQPAQ